MKNRKKRKPVSVSLLHAHHAPASNQIFQMLVNSINESRDEEILARMLRNSSI